MEPRVFTRGNPSSAFSLGIGVFASMEPRVFTRGNVAAGAQVRVARVSLQWSHASSRWETWPGFVIPSSTIQVSREPRVSRVETGRFQDKANNLRLLQWSHASSRVETRVLPV